MTTEKKRTINTFEILLLGIAVFILLSIGLQKCGVKSSAMGVQTVAP